MNTYGQSKGRSGTYSTNFQVSGRELLDASEVRLLDNDDALLFIRGERPVRDKKYDILKHPNVALTTDGEGEEYAYGEDRLSSASVYFDEEVIDSCKEEPIAEDSYLFFSGEELEDLYERHIEDKKIKARREKAENEQEEETPQE